MTDSQPYEIEVSAENTEQGMVMTFAADTVGVNVEITLADGIDAGLQYHALKSMVEDLPGLIEECIQRMVIWRKAEEAHDV